jgi:hypothetical protein
VYFLDLHGHRKLNCTEWYEYKWDNMVELEAFNSGSWRFGDLKTLVE